MKVEYHGSKESAAKAWTAACAKVGQPKAAQVLFPAFENSVQAHELRKTIRRGINAITDSVKDKDFDNDTTDALIFAASMVERLTQNLDYADGATNVEKRVPGIKAMRSSADFEKHYKIEEYAPLLGDDDRDMRVSDFLRGVAKLRTTESVQNALSEGTDASGGYTVPSRLMPGILSALVPVSSLMQAGAGIIALDDGAKTFTTAAVNAIPTAAWRSEAGVLATSDPTFRSIVATPRSLAFQFKISRELLADGQGIEQALNIAIAQAFAKELDRVGLLGSGTAPEPRGILNMSGIQTIANGANGASLATTRYGNIFSAVQAILQSDAPTPNAAIMSPRSLVGLGSLVDTTDQPLRVPGMLESVKLIGTSQISNALTVGTSTDCSQIFVGDFSRMFFAMREAVSVQLLQELHAATGEVGFACHMRADVILTYPGAFAAVTGVRP